MANVLLQHFLIIKGLKYSRVSGQGGKLDVDVLVGSSHTAEGLGRGQAVVGAELGRLQGVVLPRGVLVALTRYKEAWHGVPLKVLLRERKEFYIVNLFWTRHSTFRR